MDLDDLKTTWAAHGRALETSLRLNRQLLGAVQLDRTRSALQRQAASISIEAVLTFVVVVALGGFVYAHLREPRFLVPGVALDLFAITVLGDLIRQLATIGRIDYAQPVGLIQRHVAQLRVMRIRHVRWVFLVSTLAWTPALIVALEAFVGVDAYRVFNPLWIVANVALGVALIPLGLWASKRFGDRMGRSPFVQQLMRDIAGRNLESAERFLATLAEFDRV